MGKEKVFEKKVKDFLRSKAPMVWYYKNWAGPYSQSGIPDIIVCANGNFLGVEIKAEDGKPSELQTRNINRIKAAGGTAYILYPKDFETFKEDIINLIK